MLRPWSGTQGQKPFNCQACWLSETIFIAKKAERARAARPPRGEPIFPTLHSVRARLQRRLMSRFVRRRRPADDLFVDARKVVGIREPEPVADLLH